MSQGNSKTREDVMAAAAELGLECFFPGERELLLDIDRPNAGYCTEAADTIQSNGFGFESTLRTVSKSGNTHIYIRLTQAVDENTRVMFQTALGSDPVREILNCIRGNPASALFETAVEAQRVRDWHAAESVETEELL